MLFIRRITFFQFKVAMAISALIFAGLAAYISYQDHREKAAITADDVFRALSQGDMTRLIFCLKAKPELANVRDPAGQTPLHIAAQKGMADTTRLLLNLGGDAALKDQAGKTAADIAKEKRSSSVADALRDGAAGK